LVHLTVVAVLLRPCLEPTVIIDTREQTRLPIRDLPTVRGTLATGDYSLAGCELLFAVERKTVADLAACCMGDNRDRFERELHRLRDFRFKRRGEALVNCHTHPG
jgi:ERCC4-type nuclease